MGRVGPGYGREAQAFQRAQAEADRAIQGSAPVLQRIFDHYADGDHPYQRHRTWLDCDRDATISHEPCPQLQLPDSLGESRFGTGKDQVYQLFFAPLFASAIDRAPVAAEAFDLLDELPPVAETWGPAGALLRFLPDSQWEQGIDRIRRVIEPLVKSHEVLERGWAPVL